MNAPRTAPLRLAVDAASLVRDRRGMGRLVRGTLQVARDSGDIELTLLARRDADARALRAEFPATRVRAPATARRGTAYDVVWYPFNGMRFATCLPSLVTIHDAFAFTEPHGGRLGRWREQAPIRRAARRATRVLTDSHWSRAEIVRELGVPSDRLVVVHPAPDPFWSPGSGDALPAPLEAGRFALLVGAREERKNARLALRACRAALREPSELLVVAGELEPHLRAEARALGVRAGEISAGDATLRALYRNARVVLVPSRAEGFGLVAVEAMACGAAVIASNASALPEATGGAALLLDPGDEAGWARAIRAVFDDDVLAADMQARGRERFAGADRAHPARRILALLREIARDAAP